MLLEYQHKTNKINKKNRSNDEIVSPLVWVSISHISYSFLYICRTVNLLTIKCPSLVSLTNAETDKGVDNYFFFSLIFHKLITTAL